MEVKDIMTKGVELIDADATLMQAALLMKEKNVGCIPVRKADRVAGIITDRDIVIRAIADGADPVKDQVRHFMSSPIVYCFEDEDIEEAAELMKEKGIRRLPVMNRQKRLVGFVSLKDFATDAKNDRLSVRILQGISTAPVH